ncbi:MAG: SpoIIIAH-like family protein [Bacilli bacterium]|nr:SpoIIIAH-like family protein [Bacilli bacterium]
MINKKGLWFLTLFSLIIVLSVYYITMPDELLLTNKENYNDTQKKAEVKESDILVALRVESDNEMLEEMDTLRKVLTDLSVGVDEKNKAFEKLKGLNIIKGEEEQLEKQIKTNYNIDSFVKVKGNEIKVVVNNKDNSVTLANNIMRTVQTNYSNKMYITVKFQN